MIVASELSIPILHVKVLAQNEGAIQVCPALPIGSTDLDCPASRASDTCSRGSNSLQWLLVRCLSPLPHLAAPARILSHRHLQLRRSSIPLRIPGPVGF